MAGWGLGSVRSACPRSHRVLALTRLETLGIKRLAAPGEAVKQAEKLLHDGDLRFLSDHALFEFSVVVGAVEEAPAEHRKDGLSQDLPQQRTALLREARLSAIGAALSLPQVQSGVAEDDASGAKVGEWPGLSRHASEIGERQSLQVVELRAVADGLEPASEPFDLRPQALAPGRQSLVVAPQLAEAFDEQLDFGLGFGVADCSAQPNRCSSVAKRAFTRRFIVFLKRPYLARTMWYGLKAYVSMSAWPVGSKVNFAGLS